MKTRVEVAPQVRDFVKSLAPAPRLALSRAIKALSTERGNRKSLEGRLAGYRRLRVAEYRVIYVAAMEAGSPVIRCLFAERRSVIYEVFEKILLDELSGK